MARRYRHGIGTSENTKHDLRQQIAQARSAMSAADREKQNDALTAHVLATVSGLSVIAAYVPYRSEPGSVRMLDALVELGIQILLPVARTGQAGIPEALRWGYYHPEELVDAPFGLREPAAPALGADALAGAQLVLVPALAADWQGNRLGRGAGFYDRSLGFAARATPLITLLFAGEIRDEIPAGQHDIPVTHALTADGLITLGAGT